MLSFCFHCNILYLLFDYNLCLVRSETVSSSTIIATSRHSDTLMSSLSDVSSISTVFAVKWIGNVKSDQNRRTGVQENAAQVERWIEISWQCGYRGKHGKRLAHLRDKLSGLELVGNVAKKR